MEQLKNHGDSYIRSCGRHRDRHGNDNICKKFKSQKEKSLTKNESALYVDSFFDIIKHLVIEKDGERLYNT